MFFFIFLEEIKQFVDNTKLFDMLMRQGSIMEFTIIICVLFSVLFAVLNPAKFSRNKGVHGK